MAENKGSLISELGKTILNGTEQIPLEKDNQNFAATLNEVKEFVDKDAKKKYQPKGSYLTEHQSLAGYAKETYVKEEIARAQLAGTDVDLTGYATKEELAQALTKYVEKVVGKDLSTNDFTNVLKSKLEGLENYNDAAIRESIAAITARIDTLVGTSASSAIDTFNEIEAFLSGITDSQSLTAMLNDLKREITALIPTTDNLATKEEVAAVEGKIPTTTSKLQNDSNFVADPHYVHTDNNFTAAEKAKLEGLKEGGDGKSAYQIAVEKGFVGTEDEWLASLKGPKGDSGVSLGEKPLVHEFGTTEGDKQKVASSYGVAKALEGAGVTKLKWNGSAINTRKSIQKADRHFGQIISYNNPEIGWITEQYKGVSLENVPFGDDNNWNTFVSKQPFDQLGGFEIGENLYDCTTDKFGVRISLDGNEDTSDMYARCSSRIKVDANTIYCVNKDFRNKNVKAISFYSGETFLSGITPRYQFFQTPDTCDNIILNITETYAVNLFDKIDDLRLTKGLCYSPFAGTKKLKDYPLIKRSYNAIGKYATRELDHLFFIPWNSPNKPLSFNCNEGNGQSLSVTLTPTLINNSGYSESNDWATANAVEVSCNLYGKSKEEINSYLERLLIYDPSDGLKPFVPYLQKEVQLRDLNPYFDNHYGNIFEGSDLSTVSEGDFELLSPYTSYSSFSFIDFGRNGGKIFYPANKGWSTGDFSVYSRDFLLKIKKIHLSDNYPHKELALHFNASFEVETDMPLLDIIKSKGFIPMIKVVDSYGKQKTLGRSFDYTQRLLGMSGEEVVEVTVGEEYKLVYSASNVASLNARVKILNDNKFKITTESWNISLGNKNVDSDYYIGRVVDFDFLMGLKIPYSLTKAYFVKVSNPKFNIPSLVYPIEYIGHEYGLPFFVDTDISSVRQIKTPFRNYVDNKFWLKNPFKGAKIILLGTSVPNVPPFGEPKTKKYYQFISELLDCTIFGRAIGGTAMTFDASKGIFGLSMTKAEHEQYQSHEDMNVDDRSYQEQIGNDWDSDLFIFDHLHNDNGLLAQLKDNPLYWDEKWETFKITEENKFDRSWAVGAFNYVIAEIFRHNPRAKIAIINDWRAEPFYNKLANQVVADYWGLPICNLRMCNANVDIKMSEDTYLKRYNGGTPIKLLAGSTAAPLYYYTIGSPDDTSEVVQEPKEVSFSAGLDGIHPARYARIIYAKTVARWMLGNVILDNDTEDFFK